MKKQFLSILILLSLASCMTYNHGYTIKKGEIEASLDTVAFTDLRNGYKVSPLVRTGLRYGIFDNFNLGVNTSLFYSEKFLPTVNPYLMLSFYDEVSSLNFATGVDVYSVSSSLSFYPSISAAYSYRLSSLRPFVGVYCAPTYFQPYLGFEYELDRLKVSITGGVGLSTIAGLAGGTVTQYYFNPGLAYVF